MLVKRFIFPSSDRNFFESTFMSSSARSLGTPSGKRRSTSRALASARVFASAFALRFSGRYTRTELRTSSWLKFTVMTRGRHNDCCSRNCSFAARSASRPLASLPNASGSGAAGARIERISNLEAPFSFFAPVTLSSATQSTSTSNTFVPGLRSCPTTTHHSLSMLAEASAAEPPSAPARNASSVFRAGSVVRTRANRPGERNGATIFGSFNTVRNSARSVLSVSVIVT
mmetsp:Transcript_5752/g.23282  ORF Transcript_5752/g.23282 Transcript_5752/m.23282 type:complete len:229 (-) Transcript_5752:1827-2513(-)